MCVLLFVFSRRAEGLLTNTSLDPIAQDLNRSREQEAPITQSRHRNPAIGPFTNLHIHVESPIYSIFDTIDTFHRSVTFISRIAIVNNIGRRAVADCLYSKYTL